MKCLHHFLANFFLPVGNPVGHHVDHLLGKIIILPARQPIGHPVGHSVPEHCIEYPVPSTLHRVHLHVYVHV